MADPVIIPADAVSQLIGSNAASQPASVPSSGGDSPQSSVVIPSDAVGKLMQAKDTWEGWEAAHQEKLKGEGFLDAAGSGDTYTHLPYELFSGIKHLATESVPDIASHVYNAATDSKRPFYDRTPLSGLADAAMDAAGGDPRKAIYNTGRTGVSLLTLGLGGPAYDKVMQATNSVPNGVQQQSGGQAFSELAQGGAIAGGLKALGALGGEDPAANGNGAPGGPGAQGGPGAAGAGGAGATPPVLSPKDIAYGTIRNVTQQIDAQLQSQAAPVNGQVPVDSFGNPVKPTLPIQPDWKGIGDEVNNFKLELNPGAGVKNPANPRIQPGPMQQAALNLVKQTEDAWKSSGGSFDALVTLKQSLYDMAYPHVEPTGPLALPPELRPVAMRLASEVKDATEANATKILPQPMAQAFKDANDTLSNIFSQSGNGPTAPPITAQPQAVVPAAKLANPGVMSQLFGTFMKNNAVGRAMMAGGAGGLFELGRLAVSHPGAAVATAGALGMLGAGKLLAQTHLGQLASDGVGQFARTGAAIVSQPQMIGAIEQGLPPEVQQRLAGGQLTPEDHDMIAAAAVQQFPNAFSPGVTGLPSEIQSHDGTVKLMDPNDILHYDSTLTDKWGGSSIQRYRARNALRADGTVLTDNSNNPPPPTPSGPTTPPTSKDVGGGFNKKVPNASDSEEDDVGRSIDHNFLKSQEGFKTAGYVPVKKGQVIGKSGVTVGEGVDLGQRSTAEIAALPISSDLKGKLFKFAGLRGSEAVRALQSSPLSLSEPEADQLTQAVHSGIVDKLAANFDADSKTKFDDLPPQAQTTLASLALNFGADLKRSLPTAYKLATEGDFQGLATFLQTTKWKQPELQARRDREAQLLAKIESPTDGASAVV